MFLWVIGNGFFQEGIPQTTYESSAVSQLSTRSQEGARVRLAVFPSQNMCVLFNPPAAGPRLVLVFP